MIQYSCKIDYKNDRIETIKQKIAKDLRIAINDIHSIKILKKSVDARKKPLIFYQYTVAFSCANEERLMKKRKQLTTYVENEQLKKFVQEKKAKTPKKILIVGAGPAGVMCAYFLAQCGHQPIIIERGASMWERVEVVNRFWKEGKLDPETNVSFGEGGAGTFSDGKLNTGVKDKTGKKSYVLRTFVEHGAPQEIAYLAKPHIGTDELRGVMTSMRESIKDAGGSYLFHTKFTGFIKKDSKVIGICVEEAGEKKEIYGDEVVLAIGHSARDTFEYLKNDEVTMEQKPFAVGVRVEHLQRDINLAQYGVVDESLPTADYKLTGKTSDGRGVYSFCMCPGGYVVNASSEPGRTVVNGMSNHARNSQNANSAIVVTVEEKDFGDSDVLAGLEFQRRLEEAAFQVGNGKIPIQRLEDFEAGVESKKFGKITPCTKGETTFANVKKILPNFIADGIIEGVHQFAGKIQGFDDSDTLILGTETRTSSPVRIVRDECLEAVNLPHVYPCGEGAGYAGGIMSAAMDGIRVAMQIAQKEEEI